MMAPKVPWAYQTLKWSNFSKNNRIQVICYACLLWICERNLRHLRRPRWRITIHRIYRWNRQIQHRMVDLIKERSAPTDHLLMILKNTLTIHISRPRKAWNEHKCQCHQDWPNPGPKKHRCRFYTCLHVVFPILASVDCVIHYGIAIGTKYQLILRKSCIFASYHIAPVMRIVATCKFILCSVTAAQPTTKPQLRVSPGHYQNFHQYRSYKPLWVYRIRTQKSLWYRYPAFH